MSKSILIVICDFLLLSLLSLANFDKPKDDAAEAKRKFEESQERSYADAQMIDLLKMSLDNEREKREELNSDIDKLSKAAAKSKEHSLDQERIIAARERELETISKTKAELERERKKILAQSRELELRVKSSEGRNLALEKEILSTSQKLEKFATERVTLEKQLGDMREVDYSTKLKLQALQRELKDNKERLEKLRAESDLLKQENKTIETEKRALATRLEVATTKSQIYEENLKRAQALVDIEKNEKAQIRKHAETLAVEVSELATSQKELNENVKNLRPKTSSEIFDNIRNDIVTISFKYERKGIMGVSDSSVEIRAVPIEVKGKYVLLFSSAGTVLAPTSDRYFPPEALSVSVRGKKFRFSPRLVYSLAEDPRMLLIDVPGEFVRKEGINPVIPSETYFSFNDCVVLNTRTNYYGQVPFRADFKNSDYLKLDVGLFQSLFGAFSPSEGDVVLTRVGEFMGFVVNGDTAIVVKNTTPSFSLALGANYNPADAAKFVSETSTRLKTVPYRLR